MSEFVSVTVKHITQSLSQSAALNHPVKHTHTHKMSVGERGAPFKALISLCVKAIMFLDLL